MSVDPPTGQTFETLSISLYGNDGDLIKKFYAQDDGERPIGNIAIEVDKLKNEIIRISPSFEKSLLGFFESEKVKPKQSSWVEVIWRAALLSIVICIFASPTYFFVKPKDDLFIWLWITIGITEFFSGILFSIGGRFRRTLVISNFETVCFIIGFLTLIAYIILWILWIFQMIFDRDELRNNHQNLWRYSLKKRLSFKGKYKIENYNMGSVSALFIYSNFMAILDRINFLQLGRYGCFSEQTYRNLFEHETSTGLRSTAPSSARISQAKEKPSPSILPISPNQARRLLG